MTFVWPQQGQETEDSGALGSAGHCRAESPPLPAPGSRSRLRFPGRSSDTRSWRLGASPGPRRPSPLPEFPLVFLSVSCRHFAAGAKTPPKDWAAPSQHGYGGDAPVTRQKPVPAVPRPLRTPPEEPPSADRGQSYFFYLLLGSERMSCYKGEVWRGRRRAAVCQLLETSPHLAGV